MTIALALFLILLVGVAQWLMPSLSPPTVPFGVRIPAGRGNAQVIFAQRRRFRIATAAETVACGAAVVATTGRLVGFGVAIAVQVILGTVLYLRARSVISAVKAREDWFGGLRQVTVADTTLRTVPERVTWPWLIAPVPVLAATVVIGIAKYPSMPDRLATHFGPGGQPDHFAAKSVPVAFSLVVLQVFMTLLLGGLAVAVLRSRARLDAEDPDASARHRHFVARMSRGLLVLSACTNMTILIVALQVWTIYQPKGAAGLVPAIPVLAGALTMTVVVLWTGQGGSRVAIAGAHAPDTDSRAVNRDDDHLYLWGLFYFNPDDPAVFAPKRFGVGWTVNIARRATWVYLLAGLVALAGLISLLTILNR
jgi:uncharacterized membrane protein